MEVLYLVCGARRPQLKRDPLGSVPTSTPPPTGAMGMPDPGSVTSPATFRAFLDDLAEDARAHLTEWENQDVPSFLNALAAYSRDIDGYYKNHGINLSTDVPSFRLFADLLMGARVYE